MSLTPPADPNANPVQLPLSENDLVNGLLVDGGWYWNSPTAGPLTLSYFFDQRANYGGGPTRAWADFEKDAFRAALQAWSNVANIVFVESPTQEGANFRELLISDSQMVAVNGGATAFHAFPPADNSDTQDGAYNYGSLGPPFDWTAEQLLPGSSTVQAMIHELGHGLG